MYNKPCSFSADHKRCYDERTKWNSIGSDDSDERTHNKSAQQFKAGQNADEVRRFLSETVQTKPEDDENVGYVVCGVRGVCHSREVVLHSLHL